MLRYLSFNKTYCILTVALLIVEIIIARYINDAIIRPYVGDLLVVMLIYCFIKSFLKTPVLPTAIASLLICYFVETLQYLKIVHRLGLQNSSIARILLGTSFEWMDIAAYTCGILIVLYIEHLFRKKQQ